MKSLEEIEKVHMARFAKKNGLDEGDLFDGSPPADGDDEPESDLPPEDEAEFEEAQPDDDIVTELRQQLEHTQQQLSAMQGRVAPTQRQAEEFRSLYESEAARRKAESEHLQAQIENLREELESRTDVRDILSEDEQMMFDDGQLDAIQKLVDSTVKRRVPKIDVDEAARNALKERAVENAANRRNEMLNDPRRAIGSLTVLAGDDKFASWIHENDDSFDLLVRSFVAATSEAEVDRLGKAIEKRIVKYNETRNAKRDTGRKTDAKTSLHKAAQRRPRSATDEEIHAKLAEAKRLARSSRLADRKKAEEILNSLE